MTIDENKAVSLAEKNLICDFDFTNEADRFFSSPCNFIIGATDYSLFPKLDLPEFAFIGRSNVGKSSLLNALVKQKSLARVSVTPGRTQQVNFFCLADKVTFVDLPGYGFAKAPKNLVRAWERMSLGYLKNRINLKRLFLLIDSRHGLKKNDLEFMEQLNKFAIPYQIVLTKIDKTNKEQIDSILSFMRLNIINHAALFPDVIISSSKRGLGIETLRTYIYNALLG